MSSKSALRYFDWIERALVLGLYSWLVSRILAAYFETGNAANFILVASEGLIVFFILVRRPTNQLSLRPRDWLLAAAATTLPLLALPSTNDPWLPRSCAAAIMLVGLLFQMSAKIALGRSFGCVPAHRGLMVRGPYRFLRHPMYAGYLVIHVAFLMMHPSLWNMGIYAAAYLAQVPRLLAEERFLSLDPHYQKYMAAVRFRLLPGLF